MFGITRHALWVRNDQVLHPFSLLIAEPHSSSSVKALSPPRQSLTGLLKPSRNIQGHHSMLCGAQSQPEAIKWLTK
jgi:hypothetical protein